MKLVRRVEFGIANGMILPQACELMVIVVQTYLLLDEEYDGLKVEQARRRLELARENAELK